MGRCSIWFHGGDGAERADVSGWMSSPIPKYLIRIRYIMEYLIYKTDQ